MRKKAPTSRKTEMGFSLIELLIVVAIILVIAAIAIPGFLRSRLMANETSAAESMRTINTAQVSYFSTYGIGYAPALANLGGGGGGCVASAATACIIDPVLTVGTKSGYTFAMAANSGAGTALSPFTGVEVNATPLNVGVTGQRSYCSDQSGVIRYDLTGAAIGTGAGGCAAIPTSRVLQ